MCALRNALQSVVDKTALTLVILLFLGHLVNLSKDAIKLLNTLDTFGLQTHKCHIRLFQLYL